MSVKFYRGIYTNLWVRIQSNEALGVLDSDYIEDYDGNDGFLTLRNQSTGVAYQIAMSPVPGVTPEIPNDVFQGVIALSSIANGTYSLQGRVRDIIGNYSILGAVDPSIAFGDEQVLTLELEVLPGYATVWISKLGPLALRGAVEVPVERSEDPISVAKRGTLGVEAARDEEILVRV